MVDDKHPQSGMTSAERTAHYQSLGGLQHADPVLPTPEQLQPEMPLEQLNEEDLSLLQQAIDDGYTPVSKALRIIEQLTKALYESWEENRDLRRENSRLAPL